MWKSHTPFPSRGPLDGFVNRRIYFELLLTRLESAEGVNAVNAALHCTPFKLNKMVKSRESAAQIVAYLCNSSCIKHPYGWSSFVFIVTRCSNSTKLWRSFCHILWNLYKKICYKTNNRKRLAWEEIILRYISQHKVGLCEGRRREETQQNQGGVLLTPRWF